MFQNSNLQEAIESVRYHQCGLEAANNAYITALQNYAASLSSGAGQLAIGNLLAGPKPRVYELLICLDSAKTLEIDRTCGTPSGAELTSKMLSFGVKHNRGAVLVHNHPSQGSLSDSDWKILFNFPGVKEIVAVNSSGSVFSGKVTTSTTAGSIPTQLINQQDNSATVKQEIDYKIAGNSLPNVNMKMFDDVKYLISHLVNEHYDTKGIISYSATLSNADNASLNDPKFIPILAAIQAEITLLIP
ncbi:hypothetical protein WH158_07075 [Gluconobacter cerinus]|uniref:hypothetical protein n=1 Tax=Gluconobacter cerinus TaxID=38307 RepID=UPI003097A240